MYIIYVFWNNVQHNCSTANVNQMLEPKHPYEEKKNEKKKLRIQRNRAVFYELATVFLVLDRSFASQTVGYTY